MSDTSVTPYTLSVRQQAFVDGILAGKPQAEAYRDAGYQCSTENSWSSASRLMAEQHIKDALADARSQVRARVVTEAADIINEVDVLATSDIGDVIDLSGEVAKLRPACEISERARKAIASMKVKRVLEKKPDGKGFIEVEIIEFKLWSKPEALRIALQRRGLLDPVAREGDSPPCKVYLNWDPAEMLTAAENPLPQGPQPADAIPRLSPPNEPTSPGEAPPP